MAKFIEMDDYVKFSSQLEEDVGPIAFVNKFTVNPEDLDEFLKAWEADATYFKNQPGLAIIGAATDSETPISCTSEDWVSSGAGSTSSGLSLFPLLESEVINYQ